MKCHCCQNEAPFVYHVKLRQYESLDPGYKYDISTEAQLATYQRNMVYRSAFICFGCYFILDSLAGVGTIDGRHYGIAGRSRSWNATLYDEKKYQAYQRREAAKMGIEYEG